MIRRHFFLFTALCVVLVMAVAVGIKLVAGKGDGEGAGTAVAAAAPAKKGPGGAGGAGGRGGRGAQVTPVIVGQRNFVDRLSVLGVAKGRQSITVTANSTDIVERVGFRPGDRVGAGQVLVELRRGEEEAAILEAKADLDVAKMNAERWQTLAERGVAPKATAEQYQATFMRAKANLAAAESRRSDRVIRAPFSGVVGLTDIAPGALIAPGTAIATLDDTSAVRVDFDIPDRYLPLVREGGPIIATVDAFPNARFQGRILRLDTRIDERTRALKARAEFPNAQGVLRPGMLVRVGIDRGSRQAIAIPESSVQISGDGSYVFIIAKRGEGLAAQQTPVIVGANDNGWVEIRDGLKVGDRIVADGLHKIQPGMPVTIAKAGRPGGKAVEGKGKPGAPASAASAKGEAAVMKTARAD